MTGIGWIKLKNQMNKTITLVAFIGYFTYCCLSFSQSIPNTYQGMYDSTKDMVIHTYMTENANYYDAYGDGISYFLESSLVMYEFSKNKIYLNDFVNLSYEIICNRDDIKNVYAQKPYWTAAQRKCPGPITYHTALIIAPMAHYIYFSKKEYNTDFEEKLTTPIITFDSCKITTYNEYACWLYEKVKKTWEYYDKYYWISHRGYRQYADDPCYKKSKDVDGMDRNCNWGVVNTYLAAAFQGVAEKNAYLDRAKTAAGQLKKCMQEYTHTNGAKYYQWKYTGWQKNKEPLEKRIDDISHAGALIDFAVVCNKFKTIIGNTKNKSYDEYFSDEDITKIANTCIYKVYDTPLKYHNAINGTCQFYQFPDCKKNNMDYLLQYGVGRWLQLASAADSLRPSSLNISYHIIADFFTLFNENPMLAFSNRNFEDNRQVKTNGGSVGNTTLGIALAATNQKVFKFLGRNSAADIEKNRYWKIMPNNASSTSGRNTVNYTHVGYRIEPTDSADTEHYTLSLSEVTDEPFLGDFNGDEWIDFVMYNPHDGGFYIYNREENNMQLKAVEYFPVNQDIKAFGKCHIPEYHKDVFIIYRNADKSILLYELDF